MLIINLTPGYGIRTPTIHNPHMLAHQKVLHNTGKLLQPGALPPVDIFPILRYLPQRLFGNWRDRVSQTWKDINDLYISFFDLVIARRARQGRVECFADRLIEQRDTLQWDRHSQAFVTGLLMEAGSDTLAGVMNAVIQMLVVHPEWARKAQMEIDATLGEERMPTFADFEELSVIAMIITETQRMRPIAPLGFPHALKEGMLAPLILLYPASAPCTC